MRLARLDILVTHFGGCWLCLTFLKADTQTEGTCQSEKRCKRIETKWIFSSSFPIVLKLSVFTFGTEFNFDVLKIFPNKC